MARTLPKVVMLLLLAPAAAFGPGVFAGAFSRSPAPAPAPQDREAAVTRDEYGRPARSLFSPFPPYFSSSNRR